MEYIDAMKAFIKTDNSIICSYNIKSDLVTSYAFYQNDAFCEQNNLKLDSFANFVEGYFEVEMDFNNIKTNIVNFLKESDYFTLPYIGKDKKGNPVKFVLKGGNIDDENIAIAIIREKFKSDNSIDELTKCVSVTKVKNSCIKLLKKKKEFFLGIIDIDYFNDFNMKYGSVIGDIILIELATITKEILGDKGIISRVGGDSFVFYYETQGEYSQVRELVLQIKDRIKLSINKALKIEDNVTITMGVSRAFIDGDDIIILYNKALKALERGKKKSKDCFIIYFEEKCGPVDNIDRTNQIHYEETQTASYSAIAAVIEVLNSNLIFSKRIEEALGLIGTFFMLDRITLVEYEQNPQSTYPKQIRAWNNPRSGEKGNYEPDEDDLLKRRLILGKSNLFVCDDTYHLENGGLKECLMESSTFAIVATELVIEDKYFGLIKFEMTTHTRKWSKENISVLNLLAKILATKYSKEYDAFIHYKQMYFDQETNLFNFHKWFDDVTLVLNENETKKNITKYTILDIGIMKFSTLVSIAGIKTVLKILKTIAKALMNLEDLGIIYCRSYENRFTLFVPNDDTFLVKNIFKRVVNALDELELDDKVGIRAGYYIVDALENKLSLDEVVDRAVTARKKANINNNILEFSEEMIVIDKFKTMLISHIDQALENNEFLVYLQPKISTKTGLCAGAEALSRWNYNFEKLIFPNDFIPILESNGYIAKLDYNVFENVCIFIKELEKNNKAPIPISVNVSRSIKDFDIYFDKIEKIRKKYDVDPKYIEIEITEGMYSKDNEAIERFIDKLHGIGYRVSMDDFGSGNSNISTLSQLTFDTIKFDRGFFKNIDNEKEKMIIDTMTKLVKGMNMTVVCEGIETEDYVKYLTNIGADFIQGYYYDKPIVVDEFKKKYIQ